MDGIENAHQSARLRYLRVDDSDEDFRAYAHQILQEPVTQGHASPTVLRPNGKKDLNSYAEELARSHLGVAICLLPEEARKRREDGSIQAGTGGPEEQGKDDAAREKPIIIGDMLLGADGIEPSMAQHRTATLGISLAGAHQGRGYGREAINWALDWAFRHAGLHSVSITAASFNPRAVHLYQDVGFVLEGRRRETIWFNRGWHDELEFGMTEGEWEALRGIKPL